MATLTTAWLTVALIALAVVCLRSLPISRAAILRALIAPDNSEAAQIVTELRGLPGDRRPGGRHR